MCVKAKAAVFDTHQYIFDHVYAAYVNLKHKTLFSHLFVEAHSAEELEACIRRPNPEREWRFYATEPTSRATRGKILSDYGYGPEEY